VAVPNVSEGRDAEAIGAIAGAFGPGLRDVHADPDHNRSVFTLTGSPGRLSSSVLDGSREALSRIDIRRHAGVHPRVGALDVAPIVFLDEAGRGSACAEALVLADLLAEELELPVLLYGALAGGRTRAELRRGGPAALAERLSSGEVRPDFGPRRLHPSGGATLVGARPPLVAFNLMLAAPAGLEEARRIAARIRESETGGLPGVRAIGLWLERGRRAQVSTNVEDHLATPLATVVQEVAAQADVVEAELVGLAPRAAFAGFPDEVPVRNRRILEDVLKG
jgi:glutamate formiminotransferase